jgi:hypothetical protein
MKTIVFITNLFNHNIKMAARNISKKRKFIADGVFYSELNEVINKYNFNSFLKIMNNNII